MANMGYCRFESTLADLRDCQDNIDDTDDLSEKESTARMKLILLCQRIASDYEHEIDEWRDARGKARDSAAKQIAKALHT